MSLKKNLIRDMLIALCAVLAVILLILFLQKEDEPSLPQPLSYFESSGAASLVRSSSTREPANLNSLPIKSLSVSKNEPSFSVSRTVSWTDHGAVRHYELLDYAIFSPRYTENLIQQGFLCQETHVPKLVFSDLPDAISAFETAGLTPEFVVACDTLSLYDELFPSLQNPVFYLVGEKDGQSYVCNLFAAEDTDYTLMPLEDFLSYLTHMEHYIQQNLPSSGMSHA